MTDFGQQMTNELRFDLRKWEWNEHFEWQMMGCWPTWAKIHWNTRDFHFNHHSWIYGDYWNRWMSPLALFVCPTDQPCTARCAGLNALSPENMAQLSTFLSQVWSWSAGFTVAVWNAQRTCFSDLSFQFPSCLGSAVPVFCLHFTFSVTYWGMLLNYIGWTCFCRAVATVMGPADWFRSYMGTRIRNTPPPRKWQALLAKTGYTLVGPSWVPLPDLEDGKIYRTLLYLGVNPRFPVPFESTEPPMIFVGGLHLWGGRSGQRTL